MLTLRQLMLLTPNSVRKRKHSCRARIVSAVRSGGATGVYDEIRLRVTCDTTPRLVVIRLHDPTKPALQRDTWVHCSCEYFKFNVETALSARGSSNVVDSNGRFPRKRNTAFSPHLCKHIVLAAPIAAKAKPTRTVQESKNKETKHSVRLDRATPRRHKK